MPKLGKEKFEMSGSHMSRTTQWGSIELYLYYDTIDNYFYFDDKEIRNYFSEYINELSFRYCRTKKDAVDIMSAYIYKSLPRKRMLKIGIGLGDDALKIMKRNKNTPKFLYDIFDGSGVYGRFGITVGFERIILIGEGDARSCVTCDDNWNEGTRIYRSTEKLIEWDEDTEQFLIEMQKQLNVLCLKVVTYFTTENIEQLKLKMKNSQKLIG